MRDMEQHKAHKPDMEEWSSITPLVPTTQCLQYFLPASRCISFSPAEQLFLKQWKRILISHEIDNLVLQIQFSASNAFCNIYSEEKNLEVFQTHWVLGHCWTGFPLIGRKPDHCHGQQDTKGVPDLFRTWVDLQFKTYPWPVLKPCAVSLNHTVMPLSHAGL